LINESEKIANDVEHVSNQLMKRFYSSTVRESEEKRKLKRAEEQRSKAKKKRQTVKMGKPVRLNVEDDSSSDDPIDILYTDDEL
jgi:conjugal transfer/entry exclusion protein